MYSFFGFGLIFIVFFGDCLLDSYGFGFFWVRLNVNFLVGYGFNSYEIMI